MRSRPLALVPGLVAAGMLAASFLAAPASAVPAKVIFDIPLTGAEEIPSPGSPSGSGRAQIIIDNTESRRRVCWNLWASGTDTPILAHIHAGIAGTAGPVVI